MALKTCHNFSMVVEVLGEQVTNLTYTFASLNHKKDTGIFFSFQPKNRDLISPEREGALLSSGYTSSQLCDAAQQWGAGW